MKKLILFLIAILLGGNVVFAQNFSYETLPQADYSLKTNIPAYTLKNSIVTVPSGVVFRALFMMPVTSATSYTGQQVLLALNNDFYYNGKLIAPAGSAINGSVISVSKAKHGSMNGKMMLRFTHLITPEGLDIPISAVIKTFDNTGILLGGNDTQETAISNIDSSQRVSTSSTTVAGTGGGLVKSIWDRGEDVEIPVNASIELILTQPITVNPSN